MFVKEGVAMDPRSLLRQFFSTHKWAYVLSMMSIVISEFITVQFPNILGQFTNKLQAGQMTTKALESYVFELFIVGTSYVLLYGFGQFRNGQLGRKFEYILRKRLFDHWERLSTGYFRQKSIGDLLNHAITDIRQVREAISGGLNILTNAVFLLIATLYMTFRYVNVNLTLISILPLLFVPLFIVWWGPKVRNASREVQEGLSEMADLTEESLTAIRLVKATANEEVEAHRFAEKVDKIVQKQMHLFRKSALFQSLIPLMGSLAFVIALLYGGYLTLIKTIQLGGFVAFTLYLAMLIQPLQQIGFVINNFQRASASLTRLAVLLGEKPEIIDPPHPIQFNPIRGSLQVDLAEFRYPDADHPTLQDISFHLQAGQTLGIVGRTGSGKTTLVNLLSRIFDPPDASIFLDGCDIRQLSLAQLRGAIAYVPQDGFLFSTTIGENIGFADVHATEEQIIAAAKSASIDKEIRSFPKQYETIIGERGVTLSGGQKQRTAIARAFLKEAPILIMDDSLSAVDMNTEKRILHVLQKMRQGKTTLLIAHRLSAVYHADFIIVLREGRVVEQGTHETLLKQNGEYAEMFRLQQEVSQEGESV